MRLTQINRLAEVEPSAWNQLAGEDNPFPRHEFLNALEVHDCLHPFGWQPLHWLVEDQGRLLGALPLYLKNNSYGEFVFDHAWAAAYERAGGRYYPKLVCAIPYTPVSGPRLLVAPEAPQREVKTLLWQGAEEIARRAGLSSLHCLFTDPEDTEFLRQQGLMMRLGIQFHWENRGHRDFEDYLDGFVSKKRKQIKRERRDAHAHGVEFEVLDGHQATEQHWAVFHRFYTDTFDRKWGTATLTRPFFQAVAETLPDQVVLVMARKGRDYVAGAFNLRGRDTLFGRHYGCAAHYRHLHFEVCYYQTLEYCLRHGLKRFEAGAQGEHKLSRGFLPNATWSAHWLADPGFAQAVGRFLEQETPAMEDYLAELATHSPFKNGSNH